MGIYPIRERVLRNLNAFECSTLISLLALDDEEIAMTESEKNKFLDPYRDLEPIFAMKEALASIGYGVVLMGNDIASLFRRIENPLEYWNTYSTDTLLTLWFVVQRNHRPTLDKELLVMWAMTKLRPKLTWYPFLLGGIGITLKRERIRLIMKLPGYEHPRSFPTEASDYDWFTRGENDEEEEKEFQALLHACENPSAPVSIIGSTCFTIRSGSGLVSKLFSRGNLSMTTSMLTLDMADHPALIRQLTSDHVDYVGGLEGDYVWFEGAQVVFNLGHEVPQDLCTTFIEEDAGEAAA